MGPGDYNPIKTSVIFYKKRFKNKFLLEKIKIKKIIKLKIVLNIMMYSKNSLNKLQINIQWEKKLMKLL